ncbi:putative membrane protein [Bacteroides fragilis str. S6L5]|nr:putative membrane protein [Bacteroides fragilis str. S6L5]
MSFLDYYFLWTIAFCFALGFRTILFVLLLCGERVVSMNITWRL